VFIFFSSTLAGCVLIFVTKKANSEELAGKDFEGPFSHGVCQVFSSTVSWVASKENLP